MPEALISSGKMITLAIRPFTDSLDLAFVHPDDQIGTRQSIAGVTRTDGAVVTTASEPPKA